MSPEANPRPQFDHLTQRARRVFSIAHEQASNFHSSTIGVEHLTLALLQESGAYGAKVLANLLGENVAVFAKAVSDQAEAQTTASDVQLYTGEIELSEEVKEIASLAEEERMMLGQEHTGTQHLLQAMVRFTEQAGTVSVFAQFGVTYASTTEEARRILGIRPSGDVRAAEPPLTLTLKNPWLGFVEGFRQAGWDTFVVETGSQKEKRVVEIGDNALTLEGESGPEIVSAEEISKIRAHNPHH